MTELLTDFTRELIARVELGVANARSRLQLAAGLSLSDDWREVISRSDFEDWTDTFRELEINGTFRRSGQELDYWIQNTGNVIRSDSFMSTSASIDVTTGFGDQDYLMYVMPGRHGRRDGAFVNVQEAEFLYAPGSQFAVRAVIPRVTQRVIGEPDNTISLVVLEYVGIDTDYRAALFSGQLTDPAWENVTEEIIESTFEWKPVGSFGVVRVTYRKRAGEAPVTEEVLAHPDIGGFVALTPDGLVELEGDNWRELFDRMYYRSSYMQDEDFLRAWNISPSDVREDPDRPQDVFRVEWPRANRQPRDKLLQEILPPQTWESLTDTSQAEQIDSFVDTYESLMPQLDEDSGYAVYEVINALQSLRTNARMQTPPKQWLTDIAASFANSDFDLQAIRQVTEDAIGSQVGWGPAFDEIFEKTSEPIERWLIEIAALPYIDEFEGLGHELANVLSVALRTDGALPSERLSIEEMMELLLEQGWGTQFRNAFSGEADDLTSILFEFIEAHDWTVMSVAERQRQVAEIADDLELPVLGDLYERIFAMLGGDDANPNDVMDTWYLFIESEALEI